MLRMRPLRRTLLALALCQVAGCAFAGDVFIIANGVAGMTPEEVKEVFLGEVQFAGSVKLVPVDNVAAQADFQARVLRMQASKYTASWTKKAFRDGLSAPPMKGSDAEVTGFVRANPGAVGYVSAPPASGVTLIGKF